MMDLLLLFFLIKYGTVSQNKLLGHCNLCQIQIQLYLLIQIGKK